MSRILSAILPILFTGCLGPVSELYPENEDQRPVSVYLVSHGWHVGIAFEAKYLSDRIPPHEEIPETTYLKFGWGDHRYYPDENPGFGLLLRSALLPTRTVLHVVGTDVQLDSYFAASDVIRVRVSREGAERLAEYIAGYFRKTDDGELIYQEEGIYVNSSFFEANGYYYLPRTSNRWTARALRQTGAPISPFYAVTAGNLISQTREFGEYLNRRR